MVLSEDRTVPTASKDDPYRYLGIEQVIEPALKTVKKTLRKKYVRVEVTGDLVFESQLRAYINGCVRILMDVYR